MKTKLLYLVLLSTITFYSQTQIGTDIDGETASDYSGQSVSLSSDGSVVAIGASNNDGNFTSLSGHVRVYQNLSGTWTQIGADIDGEAASDASGISVSLSSDGNILAIGAHRNDGNSVNTGHVRIYQNLSGVWTQLGQDIDGEAEDDRFGFSVSLSSDGSVVAIGAPYNNGNGTHAGHVRVYQNLSGVWTQIGSDIEGETAVNESGHSVSLSSDGSIVAIGARVNSENGTYSGHVRVYQNISDVWTQIGADIDGEAAGDNSGWSVSLSSDGDIVAIGAKDNSNTNGNFSGHVRVYQNLSGVWTQLGQDIDGEAFADRSGFTVSLSSDGSIVAIGSVDNDGNGASSGHARIYKNNSGVWTQLGQDIDGEATQDRAGRVCLSSDGNTVAIGARLNNGVNGLYSGHARVFDLSAALGIVTNKISNSFTIYPNPVINHLQIQLAAPLELKEATIYNSFGQLIFKSKTATLDVSRLASGIYFLEVETNNGKGIQRFIKNN